MRSTPTASYAPMRAAICSGVPIRPVLKPSLYWTRSSNLDSAHMPCFSGEACPACLTWDANPATASRSACAMISRRVACAASSVSRAMTKAFSPKRIAAGSRPSSAARARISRICSATCSTLLPFIKYQSETRAAICRAARELPPWKISGCGFCTGFGLSGAPLMR